MDGRRATPGSRMTHAPDGGLRVFLQLPVTAEPECWVRVSIAGELTREGYDRLVEYLAITRAIFDDPAAAAASLPDDDDL